MVMKSLSKSFGFVLQVLPLMACTSNVRNPNQRVASQLYKILSLMFLGMLPQSYIALTYQMSARVSVYSGNSCSLVAGVCLDLLDKCPWFNSRLRYKMIIKSLSKSFGFVVQVLPLMAYTRNVRNPYQRVASQFYKILILMFFLRDDAYIFIFHNSI